MSGNWYQTLQQVFMIVTVVLSFAYSVQGKNCYQCDSTLDNNCQEKWDYSLSTNQEKFQQCDLWEAKFCIKVTGMWGGVVGTHRFCSSRDMGDQCQDIWFPDHDRMYRACVYTCSGDGCNASTSLYSAPVVLLLSLCAALWVWRL